MVYSGVLVKPSVRTYCGDFFSFPFLLSTFHPFCIVDKEIDKQMAVLVFKSTYYCMYRNLDFIGELNADPRDGMSKGVCETGVRKVLGDALVWVLPYVS